MYAPGVGRIVHTAPSERRTVAWKDVAAELVDRFGLIAGIEQAEKLRAEVEAEHTTVAEGVRQFRVSPDEKKRSTAA
jgi:hypothetical protein